MTSKPSTMILGIGAAAPQKVLSNHDLEKIVDTSDQWIRERTGIERRHILEDGKTNSDLSALAAKRALADANVDVKDVDSIIVATITPDSFFPSTACGVQAKIGAVNASAMDISAACSGFLYALNIANAQIISGQAERVLILGAEVLSRFVDWEDRATCVLFGDGAGAAVIGPSDGERGILSTYIKSDGRLGNLLKLPAGGSAIPATHESVDQRLHYIKMEGREVYKHAVRTMVDAALKGLKKGGRSAEDLSILITHQANVRIIDAVAGRLKLPDEKVFVNLMEYGNTSSASIPLAMDQACREGKIKKGDLCLLVAFGGGFTWGSSLIQF